MNKEVPRNPEDLTKDWLNAVMANHLGSLEEPIQSFRYELITTGKGLTGQIARIDLTASAGAKGLPGSLIAKFPSADGSLRAILGRFRIYEREWNFYRHLAPRLWIATPEYFGGMFEPSSGNCVLLLEEIRAATAGDNLVDGTEIHSKLAVSELARLHAQYWNSKELLRHEWLPGIQDFAAEAQQLYGYLWPLFHNKFQEVIPKDLIPFGEGFVDQVAQSSELLGRPPGTLVHGDYRWNNLLLAHGSNPVGVTVIDWQLAIRGRGMLDLAYFLVSCFSTSRRRSLETLLLEQYRSVLTEHDIVYSSKQCIGDYRRCLLHCLFRIVTAGSILDYSDPTLKKLTEVITNRCLAAFQDHRVDELLQRCS